MTTNKDLLEYFLGNDLESHQIQIEFHKERSSISDIAAATLLALEHRGGTSEILLYNSKQTKFHALGLQLASHLMIEKFDFSWLVNNCDNLKGLRAWINLEIASWKRGWDALLKGEVLSLEEAVVVGGSWCRWRKLLSLEEAVVDNRPMASHLLPTFVV